MTDIYWHPEAREDLHELSLRKQEIVKQRVKEFSSSGMDYEHFGRVTAEKHDFDMFKIKVKQESSGINQRVILDRYSGEWIIWAVRHREKVYSPEFIREILDREY